MLVQLEATRELAEAIHIDNGPELRAALFTEWFESKGIELNYIQPSKP